MTVASIPLRGSYDYKRIFTGYSDQPKSIDDQVIENDVRLKEAASNQPSILALEQLKSVYEECSIENWDGYGARPISQDAFLEATAFLQMLNDDPSLPMPDISPEVDGGIEFEWYNPEGSELTISLDGTNLLSYSGIYDDDAETLGTEPLGNTIPLAIKDKILRVNK